MVRPMIGIRPMTGYERVKRWREKKRNPTPPPEPTDTELLAKARREIHDLRNQLHQLNKQASDWHRIDYYDTGMLRSENKRLKTEVERLRAALDDLTAAQSRVT